MGVRERLPLPRPGEWLAKGQSGEADRHAVHAHGSRGGDLEATTSKSTSQPGLHDLAISSLAGVTVVPPRLYAVVMPFTHAPSGAMQGTHMPQHGLAFP